MRVYRSILCDTFLYKSKKKVLNLNCDAFLYIVHFVLIIDKFSNYLKIQLALWIKLVNLCKLIVFWLISMLI